MEFALVLPIFCLLLFGMIQYAMYFWSTQSGANAAREGARRGAVGQTCAQLTATTTSLVKLRESSPAMTVTRNYYAATDTNFTTPVTPANGTNVRVHIHYTSTDLNFPLVPIDTVVDEYAVARVENYNASNASNWAVCT